jgi:hypothetical protein
MIRSDSNATRKVNHDSLIVNGELQSYSDYFLDYLNPRVNVSPVAITNFLINNAAGMISPSFTVHPNLPNKETFMINKSKKMYVFREDLNENEINSVLKALKGER